jgi:hypothetical protein
VREVLPAFAYAATKAEPSFRTPNAARAINMPRRADPNFKMRVEACCRKKLCHPSSALFLIIFLLRAKPVFWRELALA